LRGEGVGANISEDSTQQNKLCAYQAAPLRTWAEYLREPLRVTLAIVEALVVYAVHIVAPLPLLCSINQVQLTTHNYTMQRVPCEWEVSANVFTRDVAGKGRTASADESMSAGVRARCESTICCASTSST
jgi:hypothetical protein